MLTCFLAGFYLTLFFVLILRNKYFRLVNIPLIFVLLAFMMKCISGEISWLIFTFHPAYSDGFDSYRFFKEGMVLNQCFFESPRTFFSIFTGLPLDMTGPEPWIARLHSWYREYDQGIWNDNRTLIRLNALFGFLSGGSYHIHLLFSNMLSFTGLVGYYRFLSGPGNKTASPALFLLVFLIPSVLFWGSMVSKESLALFAVGMLLYGLHTLTIRKTGVVSLCCLLLGLFLLLLVKIYLLALLVPLGIAFVYNEKKQDRSRLFAYLSVPGIFLLSGILLSWLVPAFQPVHWLLVKQKDFFHMMQLSGNSNPAFPWVYPNNFFSLLVTSPLAFLNTLTAPFFVNNLNLWTLLSFAENLLILGTGCYFLWKSRQPFWQTNRVLFCFLFVILDFILIGWITPFPGAVQRYRIITLPLLLGILSRAGHSEGVDSEVDVL